MNPKRVVCTVLLSLFMTGASFQAHALNEKAYPVLLVAGVAKIVGNAMILASLPEEGDIICEDAGTPEKVARCEKQKSAIVEGIQSTNVAALTAVILTSSGFVYLGISKCLDGTQYFLLNMMFVAPGFFVSILTTLGSSVSSFVAYGYLLDTLGKSYEDVPAGTKGEIETATYWGAVSVLGSLVSIPALYIALKD